MNNRYAIYRFAGAIGTALVVMLLSTMTLSDERMIIESSILQVLIIGCTFLLTSHVVDQYGDKLRYAAVYLMPALVLLLVWRVPVDVLFIYTIIWVACIPFFLSVKVCWLLLVMVNVAWYFVRLYWWNNEDPFYTTLLVSTFHVFALFSALTAKESEQSNEKTQQLNRQLLVTQHLLSEASRDSERTRIARDLHDLLGHHLTALTINLQVAGRLSEGEAKQKIDQCHALSKLLLNDVRDAVSELRDRPAVNLKQLMEITIADIPRLNISLTVDEQIELAEVKTAQVVLRLVQESITNTLKHGAARTASINITQTADEIEVIYADAGASIQEFTEGNGIVGMRERVESLGGKLSIDGRPHFTVNAIIPI